MTYGLTHSTITRTTNRHPSIPALKPLKTPRENKRMTTPQNRAGYIYRDAPGGGQIGYPADARPSIMWNHIDGPLLHARDGQMHWLTLWERLQCWCGVADAESLEGDHWPDLRARQYEGQFGGG